MSKHLLLSAAIAFALAACGKPEPPPAPAAAPAPAEPTAAAPAADAPPADAATDVADAAADVADAAVDVADAAVDAADAAVDAADAAVDAAGAAADAAVAAVDTAQGEATYKSGCMACHDAGVAGAPKLGDQADWGPRIAQGNDILYTHSINGFTGSKGMMPPKGGFMHLSDDAVKAAVDYMVAKGS